MIQSLILVFVIIQLALTFVVLSKLDDIEKLILSILDSKKAEQSDNGKIISF